MKGILKREERDEELVDGIQNPFTILFVYLKQLAGIHQCIIQSTLTPIK